MFWYIPSTLSCDFEVKATIVSWDLTDERSGASRNESKIITLELLDAGGMVSLQEIWTNIFVKMSCFLLERYFYKEFII